ELPGFLAAVHPKFHTPHRAEVVTAAIVIVIVLVADLRGAIGFSSFAVLTYYAIANASAWTLSPRERRWPSWLAGLGFIGCAILALTLPWKAVVGGGLLLIAGSVIWYATHRRRIPHEG